MICIMYKLCHLATVILNEMKKVQNRILVTGVFDVLHEEHVKFLGKAKELGGRLIVGIESDVRVRQLKGEGRPVNSEKDRKRAIEELGIADQVLILPEKFDSPDDHWRFLQKIKPDLLAVSSHTPNQSEKSRLMSELGGRLVVVYDHNPAVSTTQILQKNRRS